MSDGTWQERVENKIDRVIENQGKQGERIARIEGRIYDGLSKQVTDHGERLDRLEQNVVWKRGQHRREDARHSRTSILVASLSALAAVGLFIVALL